MEIIRDIEQGSEDWHKLRLGSLGGSSISKATAQSKEMKQRTQLLYDMAGEIISGKVKENGFKSKPMEDGNTFENEARLYYSMMEGIEVEQVTMIKDHPHKHYSPDGLMLSKGGLLEIKNVIPSVFVGFIDKPSIPTAHRKQCFWGMARTGLDWCDYAIYCRDFVDVCDPMIITRIHRDEKEIRELEIGAESFLAELLELVELVKRR
jgi:hypothetical protein